MMRFKSLFGVILLAVLAISTAHAIKRPTPRAQLEKAATHIVVGTVQAISRHSEIIEKPAIIPGSPSAKVTGKSEEISYVAKILISKIEKGEGLKTADLVPVRYHWSKWLGPGLPSPGDPGHRPRPKTGDVVRVYLVNKGYNGEGSTTDGGYDVYYYEGFEIIAPGPR